MRFRRGEAKLADATSPFAVNQFLQGQSRGDVDEDS